MITTYEIIIRLLLGAFVGGIIGFEREIHGRAAGFRTQLIVCVAAVLIMITSQNYFFHLKHLDPTLRIDPARLASGALIGIGFLGAGVIAKSGFTIRGLTTAASLWIVSAIGLAIGSGLYVEALITSAITIVALVTLRTVETRVHTLQYRTIIVTAAAANDIEESVRPILTEYKFNIQSVDYEKDASKEEVTYTFHIMTRHKKNTKDVFNKLNSLDAINSIKVRG